MKCVSKKYARLKDSPKTTRFIPLSTLIRYPQDQARLTVMLVGIVFLFLVGELPTHLASRRSAVSLLYGGNPTKVHEDFMERWVVKCVARKLLKRSWLKRMHTSRAERVVSLAENARWNVVNGAICVMKNKGRKIYNATFELSIFDFKSNNRWRWKYIRDCDFFRTKGFKKDHFISLNPIQIGIHVEPRALMFFQ